MKKIIGLFIVCGILIVFVLNAGSAQDANDHNYTYRVVNTYPHDSRAFTQGLFFADGYLYEGTGLNGRSSLRRTTLHTGRVLKSVELPKEVFGEGVTLCRNRVIQLTWKARQGFVYSKDSLELQDTFKIQTDGWGITFDGTKLIVSDGSNQLYFLDPDTYKQTGRISVHDNNGPVKNLNELEYVKNKIYANVWRTNDIVMIDPATGEVSGRVNLEKLTGMSGGDTSYKTLNGIAYDEKNDRLFVTGKLWPDLYEIELIP